MAFTEALARGLPVIGCAVGAVPDTVPSGTGILVPPDNVEALADALRTLLTDTAAREDFSARAWQVGRSFSTWADSARVVATTLGLTG